MKKESVRLKSFAPVLCARPKPKVLILGSMPSVLSLASDTYYGNPRNGFWKIMARLLAFDGALPYAARIKKLQAGRIALWDIYASCERAGSLDSAIKKGELNDIGGLLRKSAFDAVWLNGGEAAKQFRRAAQKNDYPQVMAVALPSTSPANARVSLEEKYKLWRAAWCAVFESPR